MTRHDHQAVLADLVFEERHDLGSTGDAPRLDSGPDLAGKRQPRIEIGRDSSPDDLGLLLQDPVRQREFTLPGRVFRIGPAEAGVQLIANGSPGGRGTSAPDRRVGIDAAKPAVRAEDRMRHREIYLKPTGMGVRRDVNRRAHDGWNARHRHLEDEVHGQLDRTAKPDITAVECLDIDVVRREG